jgi:hypothetical protein
MEVAMIESSTDLTDSNLEMIHFIRLHCMDTPEMVELDKGLDPVWKFHLADSIWWRAVKPFFYQPADIFTRVVPRVRRPNAMAALGGFCHMVPDGCDANGKIVFNEIRNLNGYDLSAIQPRKRNKVRRGLRMLRLGQITSPEVLLNDGYNVYVDWEQRRFGHSPAELDRKGYALWVRRLLLHPHLLILGAYYNGRLAAWIVVRANGERANLSKSFGHSEFHQLEPSSALTYAYVLICAQSPGVKSACHGLRSTKVSLEEYKATLGFEHIEYPSYIHIRTVIKPIVRRLFSVEYRRLMGEY